MSTHLSACNQDAFEHALGSFCHAEKTNSLPSGINRFLRRYPLALARTEPWNGKRGSSSSLLMDRRPGTSAGVMSQAQPKVMSSSCSLLSSNAQKNHRVYLSFGTHFERSKAHLYSILVYLHTLVLDFLKENEASQKLFWSQEEDL